MTQRIPDEFTIATADRSRFMITASTIPPRDPDEEDEDELEEEDESVEEPPVVREPDEE